MGIKTKLKSPFSNSSGRVATALTVILSALIVFTVVSWQWKQHKRPVQRQQELDATNASLLKLAHECQTNMYQHEKLALDLKTALALCQQRLTSTTNELVSANRTLARINSELANEKAKTLDEQIKCQQAVAKLESERDQLTKRVAELNTSIVGLEKVISDTKGKLLAAEGDRGLLLTEVRRFQREKISQQRELIELTSTPEHQPAEIAPEPSAVGKRRQWIKRGVYASLQRKGAEMLVSGLQPIFNTKQN